MVEATPLSYQDPRADKSSLTGNSNLVSSSVRSSNINIPNGSRRRPSAIIRQSLASRRGSILRASVTSGDQNILDSVSGRSFQASTMVNMRSPNFRTQDENDENEIINSVRENYLNPSSSIALETSDRGNDLQRPVPDVNSLTPSSSADPHLSKAGGDITRDIYRLTANSTKSGDTKVPQTMEDVEFTAERKRRQSAASGINVPGGFRREYIVNKLRNDQSQRSYGSGLTKQRSHPSRELTPVSLESNTHSDAMDNVPFLTRNFLEFLYIYGNFAGESFDDDFYSDDQDGPLRASINEDNPLLPVASVKALVSEVRGTASTGKVFLLLLKSFIGTGVLFLPSGFANGGLLFSIAMLVFFGVYSYWCYYILIESKIATKVKSFGDIGLKLYGPWLKFVILFAIVSTQVGFSGAYMIFTAKNLSAFVENVFHVSDINLPMIMLFQLVVYVPLSFVRNISKLSLPSLVANFFIMAGLVIVLFFTAKQLFIDSGMKVAEGIIFGVNHERWSLFIGTAIFAFEGIGLIIPVQDTMRHPEKFPLVLKLVILTATCLFISVATIGYLAYGSSVQTVILLNLPQGNVFVLLIQLFYSMAIMLSTPLQLYPAIKIIENKVFPQFIKIYERDSQAQTTRVRYRPNSGKLSWRVKWLKNLVRSAIVFLVVLFAYCGIDYLDKVVAVIGSLCCLPLVYVIPPMLHLKCCTRGSTKPQGSMMLLATFDKLLIVFGTLATVYTSYQSIVAS
ncbi:Avt4p KNAG_0I01970 [Huiozyma naganishii CBS 8797]|uniref:Amino acid transporter transmembrane domain-containing protein n=1 Tax=Huiozyma naganishii (strain ATCC MYA-139 / BCRC 22969 / CBS 8797 / KCTC 17520 / NBRC 10181 / NCYC 3082 / Yp74L-3) TaxID=1071383 RepID=J7S2F6_HUIN7|nr:hypothetical protein KNAG_0I01970 [Kazachstania naganishii CBS 8797]CCK71982.1 hypothetical protein KNAG_0I01970 [Kazachstania naganishii CBS 8797]